MDEMIPHLEEELIIPKKQTKALSIDHLMEGADFRGVMAKLVQFVDMAHIASSIQKGAQYVVEVPLQYQGALNQGLLEINKNSKTGTLWPTLVRRLESGKKEFVDNLPIRQEAFAKGNPFHELSTGMQNIYLQQQLAQVTQLVKDTFEAVQRIEKGQTNDRVGLLRSGYEGVQIALTHDGEQRQREIEHARDQIREAKGRIGEELKSRIEDFKQVSPFPIARIIKQVFDDGHLDKANSEYNTIQKYYALYLYATKMLASTYTLYHDFAAAKMTYDLSADFIRGLDYSKVASIRHIHPNAEDGDFFFLKAEQYLMVEKAVCLEQINAYDYIELNVSGSELLEVIQNDGEQRI